MKIFRRIFLRPLQILLFIILIIVALVYIINSKLEFVDNIKYIIIFHIALLSIEVLIECMKLYKVFLNDNKTNSQIANVISYFKRFFHEFLFISILKLYFIIFCNFKS